MKTITRSAFALVAIAFISNTALAVITTPPGLQPGDKFHLVFVTAGTTQAVTSNPPTAYYDFMVFTEAQNAGILYYDDQYMDWYTLGSFNMDASAVQRFNPLSPVYLLDGTKVANNGADLWDGTLQNPINVAPDLSTVDAFVWAGSNSNGTHASSPIGNGFSPVRIGVSFNTNSNWISATDFPWDTQLHLYAFSTELTAIPEPGALVLLGLGTTMVLAMRRRHRENA